MTAKNMNEAWNMVNELFPTDYYENTAKTANAGYPIYDSTLGDDTGYICDLGSRLEINFADGRTLNIWIEEEAEEVNTEAEEAEEASEKYILVDCVSVLTSSEGETRENKTLNITISSDTTFADINDFAKSVKRLVLRCRKNAKNGALVCFSVCVGKYTHKNGIKLLSSEHWSGSGNHITEDGIHLEPDERYNQDLYHDMWLTGADILAELTI